MSIGLTMKGFTWTEMIDWDDEERDDWYEAVKDHNEALAAEYKKSASSSRSRGRRR